MSNVFTHTFATDAFKGKVSVNTGLFINGQFVAPVGGETFEYVGASCWMSHSTHRDPQSLQSRCAT